MVQRHRDQSRAGNRRPPPAPWKRACSALPGSWRTAPRAPFAVILDARRAAPGHRGGLRRFRGSKPRRASGVIGDRASCGCWASARPSGCKPPAFGPGGSTPPFHTVENARHDEPQRRCVQRSSNESPRAHRPQVFVGIVQSAGQRTLTPSTQVRPLLPVPRAGSPRLAL